MSLQPIIRALGQGNAEDERDFDQIFLQTADYRQVAGMSRTLVLGGRGAGKSAIFRRMNESPETVAGVMTIALAADRTSWPALEQAAKASNNDLTTLSRQWELTFLLLVFNQLLDERRDMKRKRLIRGLDAEVKKVYASSDLTAEGTLSNVFEAATDILSKLPFTFKVEAPFVPVSIELKDSETPEPRGGREAQRMQTIVVESMYGVVDSLLGSSMTVQILADQLDDFWRASKEQVASLCALINAVMRMKSVLLQRDMDERLHFAIFLRSDIYAVLKQKGLDDATKYRRHELHLKWDGPALRRMVERRLEVVNAEGFHSMDHLFADGRLERRPLVDYFFSRLAPRPRDVIQFLAMCLEEAEMRDEEKVSADALTAAEATYSAWRRDVIAEETRYGDMSAANEIVDSLSSGPRTFTPKDWRRRLDETKREYGISVTKPQITSSLVEWGVLGVQRANGETVFIWDVPEGKRPNPREGDGEAEQESYVVHPSLWSVLDLRPARKRRVQAASGSRRR